ncbi:MAG: sigma-70 family RNA polymerase sigma factor [Planctomycetota bacterium]
MSEVGQRVSVEALLAESAWARSLAVALVGDEHCADDVLQDSFVAALAHPPQQREATRSWLATIIRNFALRSARERVRRTKRERIAAKPESVSSTFEIVQRVDLQRRLAEAVQALREPYRSAIVLRFFDGLKPGEIARRLAIPRATVRSRLRRGLDSLRAHFDESSAAPERWRSSLAVLIGSRSDFAASAGISAAGMMGWLLMGFNSKIAMTAVVLGIVALLCWQLPNLRHSMTVERESSAPAPLVAQSPESGASASPATKPSAELSALDAERSRTAPLPMQINPIYSLVGSVRDAETGEPVPHARVSIREPQISTTETGEDGAYILEGLAPARSEVFAERDGFFTMMSRVELTEPGTTRLDFSLDPAIDVRVHVVTASGEPIEQVTITTWMGADTSWNSPEYTVVTDADGRAVVLGISRLQLARFKASKLGFESRQSRIEDLELDPNRPFAELRMVLDPSRVAERRIIGRVVDEESHPLGGIAVQWATNLGVQKAGAPVTTNSDGRYELSFRHETPDCRLAAFALDWAPQILHCVVAGTPEAPAVVDFVLRRGHWLSGVVVDATGSPIPSALVRVSPRGQFRDPMVGILREVSTDLSGRFRFDALPGHEVDLDVCAPKDSGLYSRVESLFAVDTEHRIELASRGEIRGRVVDAETGVGVTSFRVRKVPSLYLQQGAWPNELFPPVAFTSESGRFTLRELNPYQHYLVYVEADGYLAEYLYDIEPAGNELSTEHLVALSRGRNVEGFVIDAETGALLPGVSVTAGAFSSDRLAWDTWNSVRGYLRNQHNLMTEADGAFSFVEDEPATIFFKLSGYRRLIVDPRERGLISDGSEKLTVALLKAESIRGTLKIDNRPADHHWVSLTRMARFGDLDRVKDIYYGGVETTDDGGFAWDDLDPGTYELTAHCKSPVSETTSNYLVLDFTLAPGEHRTIEIGSDLGSYSLKGRLLDLDGQPPHSVILSLRPAFPSAYARFETWASHEVDGRFCFRGLKPGKYFVETAPDWDHRRERVLLTTIDIVGETERDLLLIRR